MSREKSHIPTGIMIGRSSYTDDRQERIKLAERGEKAMGRRKSIGHRVSSSRVGKKIVVTLPDVRF